MPEFPFLPDWVVADMADLKMFTPYPDKVDPLEPHEIADGAAARGPFYFRVGEGEDGREGIGWNLTFAEPTEGNHNVEWGDGGRWYAYRIRGKVIKSEGGLLAQADGGPEIWFRVLRPEDAEHLPEGHSKPKMPVAQIVDATLKGDS